jgi:eukaryotic-like serine/threonine-protein kinase
MIGVTVSHYKVHERIGGGGMGVVYRAEDLRLGREVAIKLLRTDVTGSSDWLARFEREARLASSLQHPHICTIHELGEHDGHPFIAMERLEGLTVRRLIEDGPLAPNRVLDFARQIASALDAAHRRGIIHRDIKPANLFVTYGDHVKVLDFGLAKATPREDPPTRTAVRVASAPTMAAGPGGDVTKTGVAVGTASYMSPEQAMGLPLDARTDLFSLGTVLYEMATGVRAFGGDDMPLIMMKIVNGIVVPARTIRPEIPEPLDAIIQKLLSVSPENRYQTAADLLVDVDAALRQIGSRPALADTTGAESKRVPTKRYSRRWAMAAAVAATIVATGAAATWWLPHASALTERDSIVVGTIENNTGDPVFDDALVAALKLQLGQSPFLDLVPDNRIRETLQLMGRKPDEQLTHAVVREVCQRLGVKAMLDGSVATLGRNYVLTLNATDCQSGESIARAQREATSGERVLNELGALSKEIRTTLGESLPSIQKFDVPIEQATTPSLPALKAYALGLNERRRGREVESIAFFKQAIDLDPQFASAYGTLSTVYGSLGEWRSSEDYARRAFALKDRVSERERLFITYQYHDRVTGDEDRAAETLELWKASYPRDMRPPNALSLIDNRIGQYEKAESEAREALRRSPGHPFPLSNLAVAYRAMGRYADARNVAEEAVKLGVETSPTRRLLFQLGTLSGDGSAAAHVAWSKDRPREFDLVSAQADVAAFEGRLRQAADLYRRAADLAVTRGLKGTASGYIAHLAWSEALYRGPRDAAVYVKRTLVSMDPDAEDTGTLPRFRTAAALGLAGVTADAQALVTRAEQRYPEATFVRTVLAPATHAAIALNQGKPDAALEALRLATRTELGTVAGLVPSYLRAEALLAKGRFTEAIGEYEKLLEHRGVDPFAPVIPLAHLGVARARARSGNVDGSRKAYDELFAIWQDADEDFEPLAAARAEYERLISTAPAPKPSR